MATMFTRTINDYQAKAIGLDDNAERVELGTIRYSATNDNPSAARAAFKRAGVKVPNGSKVKVEKIGETTYGMTVDEFAEFARILSDGESRANLFTRTINDYQATAIGLDDNAERVELGTIRYSATNDNPSAARAAFKREGIAVPNGSKVKVKKIGETVYGMTIADFVSHAHVIER